MFELTENKAPELTVTGNDTRHVMVGEPMSLTAIASDDGIPKPRALPNIPATFRVTPDSASGLRLSWFVYRGAGRDVTFSPPQASVWEDFRDAPTPRGPRGGRPRPCRPRASG